MSQLQAFFTYINASGWIHNVLFAPLGFIVLDLISGTLSAIKNGDFRWNSWPDIFYAEAKSTDMQRYINAVIAFLLASASHVLPQDAINYIGVTGAVMISGSSIQSIFSNFVELFPKSVQPIVQALEQDVVNAFEAAAPGGGNAPPPPSPVAAVVQQASSPVTPTRESTPAPTNQNIIPPQMSLSQTPPPVQQVQMPQGL